MFFKSFCESIKKRVDHVLYLYDPSVGTAGQNFLLLSTVGRRTPPYIYRMHKKEKYFNKYLNFFDHNLNIFQKSLRRVSP